MKQDIPQLDSLIKLLNDEDDIARIAMVQLLIHYSSELTEVLRQLQECKNELLRKRAHQLQALISFKQRRLRMFNIFQRRNERFYLSDALLELHLLWYEKDSSVELADFYHELLQTFNAAAPCSINDLIKFFKDLQFIALPDSTANCDMYMLGAVLDNHCGANAFMCALVMAMNEDLELGLELEPILFEHRFYIIERNSGTIVDVLQHWEIRQCDFSGGRIFSRAQLLKFIGSMCFCNAVHDDAFRYVQILGEMLSPDHDLSKLPYPYCGSKVNPSDNL